MSDIVEKYGNLVIREMGPHPAVSREMLLGAYRAYRLKLIFAPERGLPPSRRYISLLVNRAVVRMLSRPESAVLTSVFLPCELLHAMDLEPMCAELYSCFVNGAGAERGFVETAEAAGIAETFCSYHKVLLGSVYAGVLPKPRMVVNTSLACDANNLTFRAIAKHYDIPQFYIDLPPENDEKAIAYVADQFRDMAAFLERESGKKLDPERLRQALLNTKRTIEDTRKALRLKADHSLPGDVTSELYEIYTTHIGLGTEGAAEYAEKLLKDLEASPKAHGLRILWLHTAPHWQKPVQEQFNFNENCQIVACDMNYDNLVDIDPDKPYESMARRLVESTWNGRGENRVNMALKLAKDLDVDGVICFCHWGCKQTMGLSPQFKDKLEEAGFPTLILNGDGCDRNNTSDGQIATRLSAFIEMLEKQK